MNKVGIVFSLIAILFFGTFSSSAMASVNQHANENSDRAPVFVPDRYVVVLEDGISSQDIAKGYGLSPQFFYKKALNGFAGHISPVSLEKLKQDSRVKFVEQDKIYTIAAQEFPTGMDRIDLETNPIANVDGVDDRVNAVIAVIDTGVDLDHPDLNVDEDFGYDCSSGFVCFEGSGYGDDDHNHGTHVAGIAAALDNGYGVVGVAPGATIVPVKVLRADGSGSLSAIIAGIDYVTLKAFYIDVANISIRGPDSLSLKNAVASSISAGVVYAIAAGNDMADANTTSPANVESAITVSAIADFDGISGGLQDETVVFSSCTEDTDDSFACFSNYGNKVDIAAPGVSIFSTIIGGYGTFSGTSMAAPHVAGAAALVRSQDFSMTPAAVWSALESMAIPQNSVDGFTGDPDNYLEPLLNVGGNFNQNQIPTADAGAVQNVNENTLVTLSGSGTDSDGNIASYAWNQTAGTTVTLSDDTSASPSFTAPEVGSGDETLTFSLVVTDNGGASSLANTVDINVADVPASNNPPTVETPITDLNENEDAPNTVIDLTAHFDDIEDGAAGLTYSVLGNDNAALVVTSIAGGSLTLSCATDISGTANITIQATDSGILTVDDTFLVTVAPVNDEPSFTTLGNQDVNQNSGAASVPGFASFNPGAADEAGQTSTYSVSNDNDTLFSTPPSVSSDGTLTFETASDEFGSAVVTISVQDDGGIVNGGDDTSSDQSFTITVNEMVDVSDVDFTVTTEGNKRWTGHVNITVSGIGGSIANANVQGTWSTGSSDSCTTGYDGLQCLVSEKTRDVILNFTIDDITGDGIEYDTSRNDSVELDKNGIIGEDTTAPITTASPSGGTYTSTQQITLTANEEATIRYTIDGSDPITSGTEYFTPISISTTTTLKFYAVDTATNTEAVKTEQYAITAPGQDVDVHVGSLIGDYSKKGPWNTFTVTVVVHDDSTPHLPQSGVVVPGSWTDFGTDSCTTDSNGTCKMQVRDKTTDSTTFTLGNLSQPGFVDSDNVHNIPISITIP